MGNVVKILAIDPTAHTLYTGVSMTGKTTFARHVARTLAKDHRVVVYDPVGTATAGPDKNVWGKDAIIFEEFGDFDDWVRSNNNAQLFIDESADHFKVNDTDNHWLARRGRHYGYTCHFISQRPKMIAPNVRGQCSRAVCFRLGHDDIREVAADMGHENPSQLITPIDKGDFIVFDTTHREVLRGNVFELLKGTRK